MNWDRVHELRSEVGDDAFDEVVALFLEETDSMAERLAARPDPAGLAGDLHFMKGAALNLGFDELAAACASAEAALRGAGVGAVDLTALLATYARSRQELLAETPGVMAG